MICSGITIEFIYRNVQTDQIESEEVDFAPSGSLIVDIEQHAEEWISEQEGEDDYELVSTRVVEYDDDFGNPTTFRDLDAYGEFVEQCEKHGEGYKLRFNDIGPCDMDDYHGCWASEEEFVEHIAEDVFDIPANLACYIDWEKLTRDMMMDYSSYEGDDGIHIFRD